MKWWSETLPRHGRFILILYFDDEVRGQIELHSKAEEELWIKTIEFLNSKLELQR